MFSFEMQEETCKIVRKNYLECVYNNKIKRMCKNINYEKAEDVKKLIDAIDVLRKNLDFEVDKIFGRRGGYNVSINKRSFRNE